MNTDRNWDTFARENPEAPLSLGEQRDYLSHLIDSGNNRVRYLQKTKEWKALSWWKRLITPRPRET